MAAKTDFRYHLNENLTNAVPAGRGYGPGALRIAAGIGKGRIIYPISEKNRAGNSIYQHTKIDGKAAYLNKFHPDGTQQGNGRKTTVVDEKSVSDIIRPNEVITRKGRAANTPLLFPAAVGEEQDKGMYIIFFVRQQVPVTLSASRKITGRGGGASLRTQMQAGTQISDTIAMYMPPQVQVSDNMKYADQEIGITGLAFGKGLTAIKKSQSMEAGFKAVGQELNTAFMQKVGDAALGMMDLMGGAGKALQIATGVVKTPHLELMFEGVNRREFNYTFTMTPRNAPEARTIQKIVHTFRKEMHPDYAFKGEGNAPGMDGPGGLATDRFEGPTISRYMTFPSVFDIEYRLLGGAKNDTMPRPRTCSLTKCDVTYGGGESYASVGSQGDPQKVSMVLGFSEIDIMTKEYVDKGF